MANSKIIIEFTEIPKEDEVIHFYEENSDTHFNHTFKVNVSAPNQVKIPAFNDLLKRYTSYISDNYFSTLYSAGYTISLPFLITSTKGLLNSGLGTITIESQFSGYKFLPVSNTTTATITIINEDELPVPEINKISIRNFHFFVFAFQTEVESKSLTITSADTWEITNVPEWLNVSNLSGEGTSTIEFIPQNFEELTGKNIAAIDVTIGDDLFRVYIELNISSLAINPFTADKIYYTKELDFITFNAINLNTYIDFAIQITTFKNNSYEPVVYDRAYKFPLFQGKGEFHIGTIVDQLFEEIVELSEFVTSCTENYYKTQYRPAEIEVSFKEKVFDVEDPLTEEYTLPVFKMIKGFKPFTTENQLALLTAAQQDISVITPNSIIGTSFIFIGSPRVIIKRNNVIIDDFEIDPDEEGNKIIYSYFRCSNDFNPGDSVDLIIVKENETRTQRYLVMRPGQESTYFFFENQNGLIEPIEFSGRRKCFANFKHITAPKFKNLYTQDRKVKTDISESFSINTGQLSKNDFRVISALIASLNVWCSFDNPKGPYFKIDSTQTKITPQDTGTSEENFTIDFNLLENANAVIYPL